MRYRRSVGKKKNWNINHGDTAEDLRKIVKRIGFGDNVLKDHIPGKHGAALREEVDVSEQDQLTP